MKPICDSLDITSFGQNLNGFGQNLKYFCQNPKNDDLKISMIWSKSQMCWSLSAGVPEFIAKNPLFLFQSE